MRPPVRARPPERGEVPLASGERLHLRRARLDDAPALLTAYASDPRATRCLSWEPRASASEVATWLAPSVDGWDARTAFRWVLADTADGDALGTVVLTSTPRGWTVGYAVAVPQQGRGVATAALRQVQGWVPASLGPRCRVSARTDPAHAASITVLRRAGFRLAGREIATWVRPSRGPELRDALHFTWSPADLGVLSPHPVARPPRGDPATPDAGTRRCPG